MTLADLAYRAADRVIAYFEPVAFMSVWVITFGTIRFLLTPSSRTIGSLALSLFVSVPMGVLAGAMMKEAGYHEFLSTGVASVITLLAHDIIRELLDRKRLGGYLDQLITALIDRKVK